MSFVRADLLSQGVVWEPRITYWHNMFLVETKLCFCRLLVWQYLATSFHSSYSCWCCSSFTLLFFLSSCLRFPCWSEGNLAWHLTVENWSTLTEASCFYFLLLILDYFIYSKYSGLNLTYKVGMAFRRLLKTCHFFFKLSLRTFCFTKNLILSHKQ